MGAPSRRRRQPLRPSRQPPFIHSSSKRLRAQEEGQEQRSQAWGSVGRGAGQRNGRPRGRTPAERSGSHVLARGLGKAPQVHALPGADRRHVAVVVKAQVLRGGRGRGRSGATRGEAAHFGAAAARQHTLRPSRRRPLPRTHLAHGGGQAAQRAVRAAALQRERAQLVRQLSAARLLQGLGEGPAAC